MNMSEFFLMVIAKVASIKQWKYTEFRKVMKSYLQALFFQKVKMAYSASLQKNETVKFSCKTLLEKAPSVSHTFKTVLTCT